MEVISVIDGSTIMGQKKREREIKIFIVYNV